MTEISPDGDVTTARTAETSSSQDEENGISKNNNNNNNTKSMVLNGADNDDPKIIEVHGVTEDNNSPRYIIENMGNLSSAEEVDTKTNEQLSPLTQSEDGNKTLNKSADKNGGNHSKDFDEGSVTFDDADIGAISEDAKEVTKSKEKDVDRIVKEPCENDNKNGISDDKLESSKDANSDIKDGATKKKGEEVISVEIVGKDDIDAASTYSLFMDRKDFRYYFQHPYLRILFAYLVVFFNFFIYAEDPVAHSRKECLIPMIGNDFSFITNRYPPNGWSILKVLLWLTGLVIGLFVGKLLIHGFLFNKMFRLKMFSDDQGSWMVMFMCSLITIFIMSLFYNLFLLIGGDATEQYRISDLMGVSNDIFMKAAACGTWCGDFFTAWMVTDIMLQEKLYPDWAKPVRKWWKKGINRMILFWIVVFVSSFVVIFVIATDYIQWDKLNRDFMPTNELSRAFLASFILVMDICIVMQDWDFPHFVSAIDIKLPGLNTAHIRFEIPKFLKREKWEVHITGKWFNYGVLFLVMLLDLNMWKNQMFYIPYDYGQYTGPEDRIYTVQDDYSLENFNETMTTYAFRISTINPDTNQTYISGDTHMNTKFLAFPLGVKGIAFIPSIIAFIVFGVLIWFFGRFKPTTDNPYAGRLKKRIRKRFSFRMPWRRRESVRNKIRAVPKMLVFKRKGRDSVAEEPSDIPTKAFSDKEGTEVISEK